MDKRIIKTRNAIKKAYLRLLAEKESDEIRTSDITDEAQINRTTFYLHYDKAEDVWADILKDVSDSVYACMGKYENADVGVCLQEIFSSLTGEIEKNKAGTRHEYRAQSLERIADGFKTALTDGIFRRMVEDSPDKDTEKYRYACTYVCSGATDAYLRWLSERNVTLDEFCEIVGKAAACIDEPET